MFPSEPIVAPAERFLTEGCMMSGFAAVERSEAQAVLDIVGEYVKCALS
jgi:hypothetical protein